MEIDFPTRYGPFRARFKPPPGTMRLPEFVFNLFPLEDRLVEMGVRDAQVRGEPPTCRPGCGACCRQPVPVSVPEALFLFEMLAGQPRERREALLARFQTVKEAIQAQNFGERFREPTDYGQESIVGFALDYFKLGLACPFLENESCSIDSFRPAMCREHLVSSPAEFCAYPAERQGEEILYNIGIRPILAPVSVTQALAMLYAELEGGPTTLLPLVLALDHAADNVGAREKHYASETLFTKFFSILDPLARSRIPDSPPTLTSDNSA